MQVANGVAMLEISAVVLGKTETIFPTLFWDETTALLVDAGYPGQQHLIQAALQRYGAPLDHLLNIVLTHQDIDHIGSAPALLPLVPHKIDVWSHPLEKPYIQGEKRLLKITPAAIAQILEALPGDWPEEKRAAFKFALENPPKVQVDHPLSGGQELSWYGGIVVIDTPGHSPGHISLYHQPSKTLIAGDCLVVVENELRLPRPEMCHDFKLAAKSVQKLTDYNLEAVICYHGGFYNKGVNSRIAELATV